MGELVTWTSSTNRELILELHKFHFYLFAFAVLVVTPLAELLFNLIRYQSVFGNFPMSIRWATHRYFLGQSLSFYQDEFSGRLVTKLMQTALAVRDVVTRICSIFVYAGVCAVSACFLLFAANPRLSIPILIWFMAYSYIVRYFVPKLRDISKNQASARSAMTGHVVDAYTNISTVKLFSHASREEAYIEKSMDAFLRTTYGQGRLITQLNMSLEIINSFNIFATSILSAYLWKIHAVQTGDIAVAIAFTLRFRGLSRWILWEIAGLSEEIGTIQDGLQTISVPQAVVDAPEASPLIIPESGIFESKYAIDFHKVCFHYGKKEGVIENLSLHIQPGEKVGLVGRSGAGKSTIIKTLLRFYELESGKIRIYDQDISVVRQESLRQSIAVVSQDTSLLHRSIRENITYGSPKATEAEIQDAIQQAQADEFIPKLMDSNGRKGLDAHVGERGVKLSGGQRQRIAIARVLLKNAPILILDEATSALDSEVEAAIQEQLYNLMRGKTVIAIAHRLSTIAAMDRIVVVDSGAIIEQGSHQELLDQHGLYAQLWARQSGGLLGDLRPPSAIPSSSIQAS